MRKTLFYLLLPAVCLILQGCPLDNIEDKDPIVWTDNKTLQFNTILLKVEENYFAANGGISGLDPLHPALYKSTDPYDYNAGYITSFCQVFSKPDLYDNPANFSSNSQIKAHTKVATYDKPKGFNTYYRYYGGDTTKIYTFCGNGLSSNTMNPYAANRDLQYVTIDLTIISGPYYNSSYSKGYLYWDKTVTYEDVTSVYGNNIAVVGKFEKNAAFKPIGIKPFISKIYKDGALLNIKVAMPNDILVVGNYAEILK